MTKGKEEKGQGVAPEAQAVKEKSGELPARREAFFPLPWADNPFAFMRRFAEDMERYFEDFGSFRVKPLFRGGLMPRLSEFGRSVWAPEVEVFERDGRLTVRADLPGLTKDDVKVELTDKALTLSGERKEEKEGRREGFYRSERSYGSFFRQIPLPEGVNADEATATFRNGVLEVVMQAPRREARGKTLEIREAAEADEKAKAKSASG